MKRFCLLLLSVGLFADTGVDADAQGAFRLKENYKPKGPWLTGPLLTTSAYTVPKGHFNIEPYAYVLDDAGHFNAAGGILRNQITPRGTNLVFLCQMGLTESIDLNIYPQLTFRYGPGKDEVMMGDLIIGPSFQLLRNDRRFHGITAKVGLNQLFPCARFENLDPVYQGNDGPGAGAWSTTLYAAVSKTFHIGRENFLATRAAFSTIFYVPTRIHGLNAFGGDATTVGRIEKGISFIWDIGLEFTLNLNWALALDIENQLTNPTHFVGTTNVPVGTPEEAYILSFAPAIEYNYSQQLGFIGGVWIAAYGQNSESFLNAVFAVNWYQ